MKIVSFARHFVLMFAALILLTTITASAQTIAPVVRIRLPERFRVLTDQIFDVRVEATNVSPTARIKITLDGRDITTQLGVPEITDDNDADASVSDRAWTFRGYSLNRAGVRILEATIVDGTQNLTTKTRIGVQDFKLAKNRKNIILMIGDAMGNAYRDAGRIVAKSTSNGFREGFFDDWQQMDKMPVSGMVLTHALDRVTPDSANTAAAWSMGNKTVDGALASLPDNNDFRYDAKRVQVTKRYALDNPRVETLWEYLKRKHGYRTGIVTTADVTDATPAAEGSHSIKRGLSYDIARQFVDGTFTRGTVYDVILGGGLNRFSERNIDNSGDTRDLASELQRNGYTYVRTRTELKALDNVGARRILNGKLLGLFRNGNMNVAYDKLGLTRPPDEPKPDFGGFTDQPFLDEMADAAIKVLSHNNQPFILLIEGASIDKQSHGNNFAGQLWDTIEFDKSVGVARNFINQASQKNRSLLLVTADHDQAMTIIGMTDTNVSGSIENVRSTEVYPSKATRGAAVGGYNPGEDDGFTDYVDANKDGYPENDNRRKIAVGYRTANHTATSVPVTAEGAGTLLFTGYQDQTDLFFKIAKILSSDTRRLDRSLQEREQLNIVTPNY